MNNQISLNEVDRKGQETNIHETDEVIKKIRLNELVKQS